ncbi:metabotropic glutamate receptor 2 [Trichonephila inaurata madagascariensis]|uniref:Metabotropic glutamate receptor 2 n=1 Tax=Trichonephila inaurata madagascariensis TaxID=2747483 RepID=A0A8X6MKA2_9ARAC|nr:metabotropic glutamate receptor 2 [Trichonephila inaurata madagascariensis]
MVANGSLNLFIQLVFIIFCETCCTDVEHRKAGVNDIDEKIAEIHKVSNVSETKLMSFYDEMTDSFKKRKLLAYNYTWPVKRAAEIDGDIILGGLMMIHEREDRRICGPIMPQGGIQALECMLYTMDWVNAKKDFLPGIKLGAYVLDDCDKDTYGLEQAVDFIKGEIQNVIQFLINSYL